MATFVLGTIGVLATTDAQPLLRELGPSLVATLAVAAVFFWRQRSGRRSGAKISRLSVLRMPWGAVTAIAAAAAFLAWLSPAVPRSVEPVSMPGRDPAPVASAPLLHGWRPVAERHYAWASAYFGDGATLARFVEAPIESSLGGSNAPIALDVLSTRHSGPLSVYPAVSCYDFGSLSPDYVQGDSYDLGHEVHATFFFDNTSSATRPTDLVWGMLSWTWQVPTPKGVLYQRIDVLSPDVDGGFTRLPEPATPLSDHSLWSTVGRILTSNYMQPVTSPGPLTISRLLDVGRALVAGSSTGVSSAS
jgi:hypothetical protein